MRITLASTDLTPERPQRSWPASAPTLVERLSEPAGLARYRLLAGAAPTDGTVRAKVISDPEAVRVLAALASSSTPVDRPNQIRIAAALSPHMNAPQLAGLLGHRDPAEVWRWCALGRAHSALRDAIANGELTMGHARYLLGLPQSVQAAWTVRATRGRWSVRKLIAAMRQLPTAPEPSSADIQALETRISEQLGAATRVHWADSPEGMRKLSISWFDVESLKGILSQLSNGPDMEAAQPPVKARQLDIHLQTADELSALTQHLLDG